MGHAMAVRPEANEALIADYRRRTDDQFAEARRARTRDVTERVKSAKQSVPAM